MFAGYSRLGFVTPLTKHGFEPNTHSLAKPSFAPDESGVFERLSLSMYSQRPSYFGNISIYIIKL